MPLYTIHNTETSECSEIFMSIADFDKFLIENPHIIQQYIKAPCYGDSIRLGRKKPDQGFRDILTHIKTKYPSDSTRGENGINVF